MANEVVGIDIVARLDGFREELAKIPDIGSKEAKQLATQLSREIKAAESASKRAGKAALDSAKAMKAQARAMSTLTKAVSLGPLIEGAKKLAQAFKAGVDRAVELDNAVGGDLAASLAELKGETSGLADAFLIELTPALVSSVKVMADVAMGAKLMAQDLFGIENAQARARAATEEGNKAIERQADRIEKLKTELAVSVAGDLFYDAPTQGTKDLTAELERQREVLRRLKGELKFGQNLTPGTDGKPAAVAGKPSRAAKGGPDPAKEAEAQAKRIEAALGQIRRASEDYAASLAGDEAVIRLEQRRTIEGLQLNLATVVDSTVASEEQRLEALATFKAAEVALEEETQIRIRELRKETALEEGANVSEIGRVREAGDDDYLGTLSSTVGAASNLVNSLMQAQVDAAEEGSEAQKKAMREQWEANAAMAIIQAAINIPLSVSNAMATPGVPYPVAAGFGIAAGIASGIAFGATVAKAAAGPTFHSGTSAANAPDEFQATLRNREAVLTPAAVQAIGGTMAVDRANRGEGMGQSATFIMQVNDRTTDVQHSEAIRRPDSPLAATIAESRPRRTGSARVW